MVTRRRPPPPANPQFRPSAPPSRLAPSAPPAQVRVNRAETRIPHTLLDPLQAMLGLTTFVETGTGSGLTTRQMSLRFSTSHTIELEPTVFQRAQQTLADCQNVTCWQGDSSLVLPQLIPTLKSPTLFWLDGHYSGPGTAHGPLECPLVAELAAIQKCTQPWVAMLDDARFLLEPPPPPHDARQWPRLADLLCQYGQHRPPNAYWIIYEDVVIVFPQTRPTTSWFETWRLSEAAAKSTIVREPILPRHCVDMPARVAEDPLAVYNREAATDAHPA